MSVCPTSLSGTGRSLGTRNAPPSVTPVRYPSPVAFSLCAQQLECFNKVHSGGAAAPAKYSCTSKVVLSPRNKLLFF